MVQSIAVTGDLKLSCCSNGFDPVWSVTSPGLIDGYDGSRLIASRLHSSFVGMKLACGPIVDVMKWIVFLMWWCIFILLCFKQEKKWSP